MRTFIAIEIPENIKKEILKIQEELLKFNGKKTEFENLHLTLKFLGEVSDDKIEKIKDKLREIKFNSFETEIDSIGFFDNRRNRYKRQLIIWLHMTNCENLQKEIDEKLEEIFEKEKRFMSHLTIARIKRIQDDKNFFQELKKMKIPKIGFVVKNFNLKKSLLTEEQPIYEDVEIYKLKI